LAKARRERTERRDSDIRRTINALEESNQELKRKNAGLFNELSQYGANLVAAQNAFASPALQATQGTNGNGNGEAALGQSSHTSLPNNNAILQHLSMIGAPGSTGPLQQQEPSHILSGARDSRESISMIMRSDPETISARTLSGNELPAPTGNAASGTVSISLLVCYCDLV